MIDVGVKGFLLKQIKKDELDTAIRTVNDGNDYYSKELLSFFTNKYKSDKSEKAKISKREMEILKLVAKGNTNKEIAETIKVNTSTVSRWIGNKRNEERSN
jgi:DNA-binding NarL/FixJ family response regulator